MTFSIVGHCERTDMFGVAITTSSICVGARCPHARAGVGAVATQNVTDPALAPLILDYLEQGHTALEALDAAKSGKQYLDYRQLTVVDRHGNTACHTGSEILGTHSEQNGGHCFAAGNLLANTDVPRHMVTAFEQHADLHLADRLLTALESGVAAGGEMGDVHSAALLVVHEQSFPLVDLRVDWQDIDAVPKLRQIWSDYEPQMLDYLTRALNPSAAPSYGVPGDE